MQTYCLAAQVCGTFFVFVINLMYADNIEMCSTDRFCVLSLTLSFPSLKCCLVESRVIDSP